MRPALLAIALLATALTAAPAEAAAGDSVPVLVPEFATDGDSIWIGYNVCPVAVLGDPEPCTGPHKLVEIPVGTDPCAFYGGILCRPVPEPCDVAPTAPVLCQPAPEPCERVPNAPVLCGGSVPCSATTQVDFCEPHCKVVNFDPCVGDCTIGNVPVDFCEPDVCDANDDLPFVCDPDGCPMLRPVPGFCGTPPLTVPEPCEEAPSTPILCQPAPDPCDPVGNVHPCDPEIWIVTVDGELCFYKEPLLGGGSRELLFCVPV